MIRKMSELAIARDDISECIYIFHIGSSIGIRDDTSFVSLNPDLLETQSIRIRYTAECEEDVGVSYFLSFLRRQESRFLCILQYQLFLVSSLYTCVVSDIDSGTLEGRSHSPSELIIDSRSETIRSDEHSHAHSSMSKSQCHLDSDESSSDNDELLDILYIKDSPIRQYMLTRNSLDRHHTRI